jgi:toxin YoeB
VTRNVAFTPHAWDDYQYWSSQDEKTFKRLNALIKDCMRSPFDGTGKPDALSGNLAGYWSRRIDQKNRMIYAVADKSIEIIMCRDHYSESVTPADSRA